MIRIVPMTVKAACRYVAKNHRHNRAPQGGLFACGLEESGQLVGVGIGGRPTQYKLDNGRTIEITRVCTDGTISACSRLYAALCRAAQSLGYDKAISYTLAVEPGTSLVASGFDPVADVPAMAQTTGRRQRMQTNLFGDEMRPTGEKVRWERILTKRRKAATA